MNIAFFTNHIDSGGVCNVLSLITSHLVHNHKITIYYTHKFDLFYKFDDKIRFCKLESKRKFVNNIKFLHKNSYQFLLRQELKKHKFDILISLKTTQNITAIWANLGLKTKLIIWEHGEYNLANKSKLRFYRKIFYPLADLLLVLSEKDIENYKFMKNVVLMPNPVRFPKFDEGLKENLVIAVGRLSREKRFEDFIVACNLLDEEIKKSWSFWLVGDGRERKKLIKLNNKHGNSVRFIGETNNMSEIYSKAKIIVSTSPSEGFGLTLIESTSCDIARIGARFSGDYEMIMQENENALLFEPGDTAALCNCIENLINHEEERTKLAKNARIYIEKFSPDKIFALWDEILEKFKK